MTHLTFLSNLIRRYDTLSSSALRYFKVQKCYVVDLETHTFNKSNVLRRICIYRELYQFPCYVGSDLVVCMTREMICKVSL